jgi:hypothetical protein
MKNKVTQFPQRPGPDEIAIDEPLIIFSLGDRRFTIQWTVAEVKSKPAEVIPIQKRRLRKRPQREGQTGLIPEVEDTPLTQWRATHESLHCPDPPLLTAVAVNSWTPRTPASANVLH